MERKESLILTLSDITELIKSIMPNKKFRIIGEVCKPTIRGGHLYFSLKNDYVNLKSIIWKSKNINKNDIVEGQKITIDAKVDFYETNGTINLIVDKLIKNEGQGELFKKYEEIKERFTTEGYFDSARKKKLPNVLKNILIITSENGAALQDFIINLQNNKLNINCDIKNVIVQGVECVKNINKALNKFKKLNIYYDLVVITRGGGSFEDLFGFSQPELIETVYNFHLPVLSAIGHQVDTSLLDLVADVSAPTPSLAAQYIVDHNKKYLSDLQEMKNNIKSELLEQLNEHQFMFKKLNEKIYRKFNTVNTLKNEYQNIIINDINNLVMNLSKLDSRLSPESFESINLYNKNIKINSPEELELLINKTIKLKWKNREFKIMIK